MNKLNCVIKPVKGGIYIAPQKKQVLQRGIARVHNPKQLIYPLADKRGHLRRPVVEDGSVVLKGQPLAVSIDAQSVPIHASCSGVLRYSDEYDPLSLLVETNDNDRAVDFLPVPEAFYDAPDKLIKHIEQAGITGMGGAGFPAHLKLMAAIKQQPEILIVNAVECDPYTTCDSVLLKERFNQVLDGVALIKHVCAAKRCVIALEDHQTELFDQLAEAISNRSSCTFEVITVPSKYPSGSEQQLVQFITGQSIGFSQTALDAGVLCFNVSTVVAIDRAISTGEPVLDRIVSIDGPAVPRSGNYQLPIGMPLNEIFKACGVSTLNTTVISGGVMMGHVVDPAKAVIQKETYSLWITEALSTQPQQPCIRCAECAYVCPSGLQPQSLFRLAEAKRWNVLDEDSTVFNCIECGACDLVCPSHIPLTQVFVQAKQQLDAIKQSQAQAQHAQKRYLARQERLKKQAELKRQVIRKRKQPADVNAFIERIKNKVETRRH